jgi:hypothetical protein
MPNWGRSVPLLARPFHECITLLVAVRARLDEKTAAVSSTIPTFLGVLDMPDELRDRYLRVLRPEPANANANQPYCPQPTEIKGLGQDLDELRWIS